MKNKGRKNKDKIKTAKIAGCVSLRAYSNTNDPHTKESISQEDYKNM